MPLEDLLKTRFNVPKAVPSKKIFDFINGLLRDQPVEVQGSASEGYDASIKPIPCASFKELIKILGEPPVPIYFDEGLTDTFAAMFAAVLGVKLGGLPVWFHVIGPPSSGKTTLIEALEAAYSMTYSISKFTGMFSGFVSKKDPGMMPKVNGKCMLIKDLTPLLSSADFVKIMGELRDLYDGRATAHYGNEMNYDYQNVNFGVVSCVTDDINKVQHNLSAVGERFLRIHIDKKWRDDGTEELYPHRKILQTESAVRGLLSKMRGTVTPTATPSATKRHKAAAWGLLNHLVDRIYSDTDFIDRVFGNFDTDAPMFRLCTSLAEWVAVCRATVDRNRQQDISYRQNTENITRLTCQFTKLGVMLCLLFDVDTPSDDVLRILRKVAFDTGFSFNQEIMNRLAYKGVQNVDDLERHLRLSETHVTRILDDLAVFDVITFDKLPQLSGSRGRKAHGYRLNEKYREIADTLGLFEQQDPSEEPVIRDYSEFLGIRKRA